MYLSHVSETLPDPDPVLFAARHAVYDFLSRATASPYSQRFAGLANPARVSLAVSAADYLSEVASEGELAPGELTPTALDLEALAHHCRDAKRVRGDYDAIFGLLLARDCPPIETEYCRQTFSVYRSQHLADIAGFYRAFGLQPSRVEPERADHITTELEFLGWLIAKEDYTVRAGGPNVQDRRKLCVDAQRTFFGDHFGWWVPAFAYALRCKAEGPMPIEDLARRPQSFYGAVAHALAAWTAAERLRLSIPPPEELVESRPSEDPSPECGGCG